MFSTISLLNESVSESVGKKRGTIDILFAKYKRQEL